MKTSVIIPYQKGEAFLRDCLDSLKEQTGQDMEVLLICDHVAKQDLTCLAEYENDLSIQIYHLTDKTGVAAARNKGLEKATGDYVYFLDSDDYLYGNTIENLVNSALDRDDDIVYSKLRSTWFSRNVFLVRKQQDNESDRNETLLAEMNTGTFDDSRNDSDDSNEDASETDGSEGEDKDDLNDDRQSSVDSGDSDNDENIQDEPILTPEEQEELKELRKMYAYKLNINKVKDIRNISVLNILFKRSYLEDNRIRFPENLKYMSDLPFLIEALGKTEKFKKRFSAKYIKRKHNDSINFPSLSQIKDHNRFKELIAAYYEAVRRIPEASMLRDIFQMKFISYYTRIYSPRLKRSSNDIWRQENFLLISDVMGSMSHELLKTLKGYKKRIIKSLIRKDLKKSIRQVKIHLAVRKLKKILINKRALGKFLYEHIYIKKPLIHNCILFESFFGKSYSDSPKYIYEYLSGQYQGKYKCIWVIDKKFTKIPYKHKKIKRFSLAYYYYLACSEYFVFNGRQPEWVRKRADNKFLQTWHGTPLKKLVFDLEDISSASPKYKKQVYKQQKVWDYLIAPNAFSSETFRRCFMFENTMLETGYPRNDILHAPDSDLIAEKLKKKLKIPMDKKVILYAPTWRDDEYYAIGKYKFELHLNLNYMRAELGNDYVILLRTHYFIADSLDVSNLKGFAYNMSRYDDISELYLLSDILITDYSSVFFDYANLKRPMLFFTYDLEKYRDVLRGFYFDIEREVPGPLLFTTEEVVDAVKKIKELSSEYSQRYDEFYHKFCEWEDGHASEKVVKSVFERQ